MSDPRIEKLAQVLVQYSLELEPGDEFSIYSNPLAEELTLSVFREALKAGAHITVFNEVPGSEEIFYKYASDTQLEHVSPIRRMVVEHFSANLIIMAPHNTRELSAVAPERIARARKARAGLTKTFFERSASGDFKWCDTAYPTNAMAQEADMSLEEYRDFVFGAGLLDKPNPIAAWREMGEHQRHLAAWLKGKKEVQISGPHVDLKMSIHGRTFGTYNGKYNFPDGEIATSPVEKSASGWVRFSYPAIFSGQEVDDIELWFEDGRIVREKAGKGQELLTALLNTDAGSRYIGELGIGTNDHIKRFTKNMLFDEKMGGTIHLAAGFSLPGTGGQNQSSLHWDMLCDMADSEIHVDGELFYRDGEFII
jgi:aminopeptidase